MRAIQVRSYGGPEELVEWELGIPEPGPGEALLRITHAGVNFTDIYTRQGVYRHSQTYRNQPPHTNSKYQIRLEEAIKIFNLKPVYIYLDSYSKDDKQDKIISQKGTFG